MKEGEPLEPKERWPIGRAIVERVRADVNDAMSPFGDRDVDDPFTLIYLRERDGCIPDEFVDEDLLAGIHSMYYAVLDAVCVELRERTKTAEAMNIVIDPSHDDTTNFVVHTFDKVLLSGGLKAWHLYWESKEEMERQMEDWYARAASALPKSQEPTPDGGRRYTVTLHLERLIDVDALNANQALERAATCENNEDDPEVQMLYEEVTGHSVEEASDDDRTTDGGDD